MVKKRIGVTVLLGWLTTGSGSGADATTYHYDLARTGLNASETILKPDNVNSNSFRKVFSYPVDGYVYAQPLYLSGVAVAQQGLHDMVFVATEHDSVYAFDANASFEKSSSVAPLWKTSFIDPAHGVTTVSDEDVTGLGSIVPEIGITSTPVIDPATGTLYMLAKTKETSGGHTRFVQRLHALDVGSGAEKFGGPVEIAPLVPGKGDGTDGAGNVPFNARTQLNRPGLLLVNGAVYACWASHGDTCPYHGWVIGYDSSGLTQLAAFNTTPNSGLGGIWQAGGAPAADASGNVYVITGNGPFDASRGGANYGDTFLKLDSRLHVVDYFTPYNQLDLDAGDSDLGSGGPMLLPSDVGGGKSLLVGAGKEGTIYLLDTAKMGGFSPDNNGQILQVLTNAIGPAFGTPAYFDHTVFYAGASDFLKAFSVANGLINPVPSSRSSQKFRFPGATPSISANGSNDGIVWLIERSSVAVLHAFDARDVSRELYNSAQAGARDSCGPAVKFSVPIVANGRVFVGTQDRLEIFGQGSGAAAQQLNTGLLSAVEVAPPLISPAAGPYPASIDVTISNSSDQTEVRYTLDGSDPTDYSPLVAGAIRVDKSVQIKAAAFQGGARSSIVSAVYDIDQPTAAVRFLLPDVTTQGNWVGSYGANGHHVYGDAPNYPESVRVQITGATPYLASTVSPDMRAPQKAFCPAERIVGLWYSTDGFTIDVDLLDAQPQQIALYLWDIDGGRAESIEIRDAWSNRVLDVQELQDFSAGIYFGWEVTGHVKFLVTRKAGGNAVVNGLFFDAVNRPSPLRINASATNAVISWPVARGDFQLESTGSLGTPFQFLRQPTNTTETVDITSDTRFFRLHSAVGASGAGGHLRRRE